MKIPKFTLQLYSFLYDCLMDFPAKGTYLSFAYNR